MAKHLLHFDAKPSIFENAKELRRQLTNAEKKLWNVLRNRKLLGYKFRRQHPINNFIADFYCHEKHLVIELDGDIHDLPEQIEYDEDRTYELEELGVIVIRFTNNEVEKGFDKVLEKIKKHLISSFPSPSGEGVRG